MGKLVEEEIIRLLSMTDEEIMGVYANQVNRVHPHMVVVNAVGYIMQERNIQVGNMTVGFTYTDSTGEEKFLKLGEK